MKETESRNTPYPIKPTTQVTSTVPTNRKFSRLLSSLADHSVLIRESSKEIQGLKESLAQKSEATTYAAVTARASPLPAKPVLHSIAVASKNVNDTGDDVLGTIRTEVKGREDGICIDRIRKSKDRKVVISCRTEAERSRVRDKLKSVADQLDVQDVKNQNHLVVLRDVLRFNKDEDVTKALRTQNDTWNLRLRMTNLKSVIEKLQETLNVPHNCAVVSQTMVPHNGGVCCVRRHTLVQCLSCLG